MSLTRRQLLQLSTVGGLGALAEACTGNPVVTPDGEAGGMDAAMDTPMDTPVDTQIEPMDTGPADGGTVMAHVVIIGSGFGGSVAALRLAQAGIQSIVLERGKRWPIVPGAWNTFSGMLVADRRSTWLSTMSAAPLGPSFAISKYVGVLEHVQGNRISMYCGAGVGGGSLVYGGVLATPRADAYSMVFPASIPYAEMSTYYARARMMMNAGQAPADILTDPAYLSETVFRDHATRIGVEVTSLDIGARWDVIRQEMAGTIPRSALDGAAIFGNNNGCKISVDQTYLKQAEDSGMCTVMPQHLVRDITRAASGKYVVMVDQIDTSGTPVATKTFVCDFLFVAAGPHGTPNLFVKAKAKGLLPMLDDNVGQGFGNNGNAMFARWGLTESTGTAQGGFVGRAMVDMSNTVAPAWVEHAQLPTGTETHCVLQLGMSLVTGTGSYVYNAAEDRAVPTWPASGSSVPVAAMQNLADRLNAANGGVLNGSAFGGALAINGILGGSTYHPLGGMVIGQATDLYGRVNNYPRLYVLGAPLLPRMAGGVNPALGVTAMAERCVERIIRDDMLA